MPDDDCHNIFKELLIGHPKMKTSIRNVQQTVIILWICFLVSALIYSCGSSSTGFEPCIYSNNAGTATIESIVTSTFEPGLVVSFSFTPANPNFTPPFGEDNGGTLYTVGPQQLPSAELLSANGITVGEALPADFEQEVSGTCTPPPLFTFPTLSNLWGH
ncbi:MAG TPA: hypothetical protein VEI57_11595 [Nitrospirota bacterium]|nr:hypothetical protein [Nitrospirota bacterium]